MDRRQTETNQPTEQDVLDALGGDTQLLARARRERDARRTLQRTGLSYVQADALLADRDEQADRSLGQTEEAFGRALDLAGEHYDPPPPDTGEQRSEDAWNRATSRAKMAALRSEMETIRSRRGADLVERPATAGPQPTAGSQPTAGKPLLPMHPQDTEGPTVIFACPTSGRQVVDPFHHERRALADADADRRRLGLGSGPAPADAAGTVPVEELRARRVR